MNIKEVHDIIYFYIQKAQNGYVSHEEIDSVLDRAQMSLFADYYFNPKQQSGYGDSQRSHDALSPFKAEKAFTTTDTPSGVLTAPADYLHLIGLYTSQYSNALARNTFQPVSVVNEEELVFRLASQVVPISFDDPVAIINSNKKIQLFPDQPQSGKLYYFRRPAVPKFGYTAGGRKPVYNAGTSTQLEWNENEINNIVSKALSILGLNLSSQDVLQYGELKDKEG